MVGKFKKLLVEIGHLSTEDQKAYMEKVYREWKQSVPQVDDIVFIGIRI